MKILYHHRTLGDGAEGIHIREMVRAFRNLGHEVRVIGPAGESAPQPGGKPSKLAAIKRAMPGVLFELLEVAYTFYAFMKATLEIRRFRPDFIYDRYITFNAGLVLASKMSRVPMLLEVNAPLALERREQQDEVLWLRGPAASMERWICAKAGKTIVVSTPLKDYLESIGVPPGQCEVMPNGVDPLAFSPRPRNEALARELGVPEGAFVIGFTGVLRPWHGVDLLLQAAAALLQRGQKICILIVGDGPHRPALEKMINELGLASAVVITGRVPHQRVPDYVSLFDVAVSPRATFYASPMKVVEYMAAGKAVVVPHTPNFLDMVDNGVNGVTFEEGNAAAMADALGQMCVAPDKCRTFGQQARRKVETRLNWEWNARRSCDIARELSRVAHAGAASAPGRSK